MQNDQFMRLRLLVGDRGMEKIQKSFVVVAGLGAVGGYALEALARAGVGKLRLIDSDSFSLSNINRQVLALHSTVGREKTVVAAERVKDINPACETDLRQSFINAETIPALLNGNPDFVVDAIDSLNPKTDLIAYLRENNMPFVSSMGAALRTDPSKIAFGKMRDVTYCRLAFMLRKRLRRRNIPLDFPCVYSTESRENIPAPVFIEENELAKGLGRDRAVMGSLPTITGIFGLMLANYVITSLYRQPD